MNEPRAWAGVVFGAFVGDGFWVLVGEIFRKIFGKFSRKTWKFFGWVLRNFCERFRYGNFSILGFWKDVPEPALAHYL